jgi:hypothetical protein
MFFSQKPFLYFYSYLTTLGDIWKEVDWHVFFCIRRAVVDSSVTNKTQIKNCCSSTLISLIGSLFDWNRINLSDILRGLSRRGDLFLFVFIRPIYFVILSVLNENSDYSLRTVRHFLLAPLVSRSVNKTLRTLFDVLVVINFHLDRLYQNTGLDESHWRLWSWLVVLLYSSDLTK